jgi:zinc transport system substrate-binding protein
MVTLAGCSAGSGAEGAGSGAEGGRPDVVTSFYPLEYVAERIAGDHAEVDNLTSAGVEPHDLELSVVQTAEVSDADLLFYEKGFQPAVDEAIGQSEVKDVVEITEVVSLKPGEGRDEGADPHFWLDPERLGEVAAAFAEQMSQVDPAHASSYRAHLAKLRSDLSTLDQQYTTGLTTCKTGTVVVSHDAFGYLEKYGIEFEAINGLSPDAEPSPAHIAMLQDLVRSEGITTVFSETLASPALAETLAGDVGIETAVLDPIEGLSESTAEENYLTLMEQNLVALKDANRCS